MLFSCPCGTVINVPTKFYFWLSMRELEERCIEEGVSYYIEDPFEDSYMSTGDRTRTEEEEEEENAIQDPIDTRCDIDYSDMGYED